MGTSIACGVGAVEDETSGYLVCLGDMPLVKPETIKKLTRTFLDQSDWSSSIVRPRFEERAGHPVIFGRSYSAQLKALSKDEGARSLITSHRDRLKYVDVNDPGVVADIDTQDDYRQLKESV